MGPLSCKPLPGVDFVVGSNIPAANIAGRLVPRPSADDVAFIVEASVVHAAARNPGWTGALFASIPPRLVLNI